MSFSSLRDLLPETPQDAVASAPAPHAARGSDFKPVHHAASVFSAPMDPRVREDDKEEPLLGAEPRLSWQDEKASNSDDAVSGRGVGLDATKEASNYVTMAAPSKPILFIAHDLEKYSAVYDPADESVYFCWGGQGSVAWQRGEVWALHVQWQLQAGEGERLLSDIAAFRDRAADGQLARELLFVTKFLRRVLKT